MNGLDDADFGALARYLADEAGLVFDTSRRSGLSAVVAERLAAAGIERVSDYLAFVRGNGAEAGAERQALLDGAIIGETHFYRNGAQIDALRTVVLPELMGRAAAEGRALRVWSAGCSTGEEPYTLAMLAREVAHDHQLDVTTGVLGTDVSAAALSVAESATYAGRTVDLAEPAALTRWFDGPYEAASGAPPSYRVRAEIRDSVRFARHNLVADPPPFSGAEVDLVVCRNVTIYFSRETTRALVERFHQVLRPGGYLMLGHAETLWQISDAYSLVPVGEAFVYRKDPVPSPLGETAPLRPSRARPAGLQVRPGGASAPVAGPTRRAADPLLSAARTKIEADRSSVAPPARRDAAPPEVEPVSAEVLLDRARGAAEGGHYATAAELAGAALAVDPLCSATHVVQGQARATLGDDEGALDALRKAVYLEPAAGHAHFLLAGALARLGRAAAAARSFRAAAASLHQVSPEIVHALLDGRDVAELVELCHQLAEASERAAAAGSTPGRSTV